MVHFTFVFTVLDSRRLVTIHRRDRKDRKEKPFREKKKKEYSATSAFLAVKNVSE
jgi:hypothetical protein